MLIKFSSLWRYSCWYNILSRLSELSIIQDPPDHDTLVLFALHTADGFSHESQQSRGGDTVRTVTGVQNEEADTVLELLHPHHGPAVSLVLEVHRRLASTSLEVVQQPLEHCWVGSVSTAWSVEIYQLAVNVTVREKCEDLCGSDPLPERNLLYLYYINYNKL